MQHTMIYRDNAGTLQLQDCTCGEDHGPSINEERLLLLQKNEHLRLELEVVKADRDARSRLLDLALRRLIHLRKTR